MRSGDAMSSTGETTGSGIEFTARRRLTVRIDGHEQALKKGRHRFWLAPGDHTLTVAWRQMGSGRGYGENSALVPVRDGAITEVRLRMPGTVFGKVGIELAAAPQAAGPWSAQAATVHAPPPMAPSAPPAVSQPPAPGGIAATFARIILVLALVAGGLVGVVMVLYHILQAANVGNEPAAAAVYSAGDRITQAWTTSNVLIVLGAVALLGLIIVLRLRWRPLIRLGAFAGLVAVLGAGAYLFGSQLELSGYAILAKPLAGAHVNVYALRSDGQPGALLATTLTDPNGYYSVGVRHAPPDSLLVVTSGGTSVDMVSGQPLILGQNEALRTVVKSGSDQAPLTPLTTWAAARAMALAASGKPLVASIAVSNAAVARQYNLETITGEDAAIADDPHVVQLSGRGPRQIGLILAGLDQEANALGVTEMALTAALARDLSDGNFDGKQGSTPITIPTSTATAAATTDVVTAAQREIPLPPDAGTQGLQAALSAFVGSAKNVTHLQTPQISLAAAHIDLNTAGLLYVSSSVLPAWHEGESGTALITGSGGSGRYHCRLAAGSPPMPRGFQINDNCTVSGLAPAQADMTISGPFTITMFDESSPPQSVDAELRITIVQKPPVIAAADGNCAHARERCAVKVATASGGSPPYYFTVGSLGFGSFGSPPLGMIFDLNGVLTGTPAIAGTYTFAVCVVDLVGNESCAAAAVTVGNVAKPDTPNPAPNNRNVPTHLPPGFPASLPEGQYQFILCVSREPTCRDFGTQSLTADDVAGFNNAITSIENACTSACTTQVTPWNGSQFGLSLSIPQYPGGWTEKLYVRLVG
jgi:hypothetical protein